MIEAINGKGVSRAYAVCDDCGRKEAVTCDYDRLSNGDWRPNEGQVKKKITGHGWADVKGKLRCPSCESKRKVVKMPEAKSRVETQEPPEPSKRQRIEIFTMLAEVYDLDAQQYSGGETDETVADILKVRPGWVTQIREAEFGPAGNEDMDRLRSEIDAEIQKIDAALDGAEDFVAHMKAHKNRLSDFSGRLDRITKAVGPRVMKRAGG